MRNLRSKDEKTLNEGFVQVSHPKWAKYFRYVILGSPPNSLGEQSVLPMKAQMVLAAFLAPVSKDLAKLLKRERVRLQAMEDTVVCGGGGGESVAGTLTPRAEGTGRGVEYFWLLILARWERLIARTDF